MLTTHVAESSWLYLQTFRIIHLRKDRQGQTNIMLSTHDREREGKSNQVCYKNGIHAFKDK